MQFSVKRLSEKYGTNPLWIAAVMINGQREELVAKTAAALSAQMQRAINRAAAEAAWGNV